MPLDLTPDALVNSGSGFVYLLLGFFVLLLRPTRGRSVVLGLFLVAFALRFISRNLTATDDTLAPGGYAIATASCIAGTVLLAAYLRDPWRRLPGPHRRLVTGFAGVHAVAWATGSLLMVPRGDAFVSYLEVAESASRLAIIENQALAALVSTFGVWYLVAALGHSAGAKPGSRGLLLAALCFCLYGAYDIGTYPLGLAETSRVGGLGYFLSEMAVLSGPLVAFAVVKGLLVRRGTWAIMSVAFLGGLVGDRLVGDIGVVRLLAFGLLVYAITNEDLLGIPLHRLTIRTGVLASVGLAGLFVTAQVAQNFLSATYGLYLGGAVAGIAVFAAFPLQRAAERSLERRARPTGGTASENYRRQVEIAWTDGRLGANERLLLAESRRQLGLTPAEAEEIEETVARKQARGRRKPATRRPRDSAAK